MNDEKEFFESLNNSKNKALFSRMKNGDIGVRDEIILSNLNLVKYIINKKFMNTSFDYKDLESVGIIGLIKAVDAFDADKGFKFSTYAITCIENEILMLFRKNYSGEISYDAPLYIDKDGQVLRYSDIIADENVNVSEEVSNNDLGNLMFRFICEIENNRDREIIKRAYGFGCTYMNQVELSKKFNLSQGYISKLIVKYTREIASKLLESGAIVLTEAQIKKLKIIVNSSLKNNIKRKPISYKNKSSNLSLFDRFSEYTAEEIMQVFDSLTEKDKELLYQKFGEKLDTFVSNDVCKWDKDTRGYFFSGLLYKIERRLKKLKSNEPITGVKPKTMYEFFKEYTPDEINSVVKTLTDDEIKILHTKFGDDFISPVQNNSLSVDIRNIFYYNVSTKIKRRLAKARKKEKELNEKNLVEYLRKSDFNDMFSDLSTRDALIISMRFGFIDDKCYSLEEISDTLKISKKDVIKSIRDTLVFYNKEYNPDVDISSEEVKYILKMKKG